MVYNIVLHILLQGHCERDFMLHPVSSHLPFTLPFIHSPLNGVLERSCGSSSFLSRIKCGHYYKTPSPRPQALPSYSFSAFSLLGLPLCVGLQADDRMRRHSSVRRRFIPWRLTTSSVHGIQSSDSAIATAEQWSLLYSCSSVANLEQWLIVVFLPNQAWPLGINYPSDLDLFLKWPTPPVDRNISQSEVVD